MSLKMARNRRKCDAKQWETVPSDDSPALESETRAVGKNRRPAYTLRREGHYGKSDRLLPADDRNPAVADEVLRKYKEDPLNNSIVEQLLYKYDAKGLTPDKFVGWQNSSPRLARQCFGAGAEMGATPTAAPPPMALKEDNANNESKYDDGNDIVANGSIQAAIAMRNKFNILGSGFIYTETEKARPTQFGPSKSCRKTTLEVGLP